MNVHGIEKSYQSIKILYVISEYLRQEINPNFYMTDPSYLVDLMSFSGAQGNYLKYTDLLVRED